MRALLPHAARPPPHPPSTAATTSRRAHPPPPRGFSRIPFESLDFDPLPPRRRRPRRPRRRRDEDDEEEDDEIYDPADADDGQDIDRAAAAASSPVEAEYGLMDETVLPGTQVARMKDLQAEAEQRRDAHFAMYRAHSWKANILSAVVLICTTAGGTSGLISLTMGGEGAGEGGEAG